MLTSGDRLRTLLKDCHLSPSDLALHRNVLPQHVNNWIRRGVPVARMDDIAQLLCVHSRWLRTGLGPKYRFPPPLPPVDPQDEFYDQDSDDPTGNPTVLAATSSDDVLLAFHRPLNRQFIAVEDRHLRLPRAAFEQLGVEPTHCAALVMPDGGMAPRIPLGAPLAIDRSMVTPISGQPFAFLHNGELRVRTLYPMTCDAMRLRADKLGEFGDELVSAEEPLEILGWVFWWASLQAHRPGRRRDEKG